MLAVIPVVLAIGTLGTTVVTSPGRVAEVVDRFEGGKTDARSFIWEDAAGSEHSNLEKVSFLVELPFGRDSLRQQAIEQKG